jgi:putative oxidoreductase
LPYASLMRRLFSTFAHGAPGIGLLLLRLVSAIALLVQGYLSLLGRPPLGPTVFQAFSMALGILLLAGLWTPLAGSLVALVALWNVFSTEHPWRWIMLATVGAALALLGPGTWSVDARLYGWKQIKISDRRPSGQDSPTPP